MAKQRKDWERIFEDHFCHQLDTKWGYRIFRDSEITVDKVISKPLLYCIDRHSKR